MITSFFAKSPTKAAKRRSPRKRRRDDAPTAEGVKEEETVNEEDAQSSSVDSTGSADGLVDCHGVTIHSSWAKCLKRQFQMPYFKHLMKFVANERKSHEIFPPEDEVFAVFNGTPLDKVRVVIIGQDPYHDNNQAHGLCFSVKKGVKIPPSLRNMIKEATEDVGIKAPSHGCLTCWAEQGVLLLNTVMTVQAHKANSHRKQGWEKFTDAVIAELNKRKGLVFVLWGKPAQKKGKIVNRSRHCVIESAHPSPLAAFRGFFGSKPFSKANAYLKKQGHKEIDWSIV